MIEISTDRKRPVTRSTASHLAVAPGINLLSVNSGVDVVDSLELARNILAQAVEIIYESEPANAAVFGSLHLLEIAEGTITACINGLIDERSEA
jgi:hypothetical protein